MLNRARLTLFGRLYLYTFVGISTAVFLTKNIMDMHYEEDDFIYFFGTTNYLLKEIDIPSSAAPLNGPENYKIIHLPSPYDSEFVAMWVSSSINAEELCGNCQHVKNIDNGKYYYSGYEHGLAIFSYEGLPNHLLITDADYLAIGETSIKVDRIENAFIYFLIGIISLFVGLTMYWPLRKLHNQITKLIRSHQRFGEGNFQEYADENVEKPLDELAISFNMMARSIESNVNESHVFAQAIPHELRTPLSRIQLASGLLRKNQRDKQNLELLDDVDHYIDDINDLIRQIVSLSKLKTSLVSKKPYSEIPNENIVLKDFIEKRISEIATNNEITISVDITHSRSIISNPTVLRLALDNLISNALKHANTCIEIKSYNQNENITISVEDDGDGISASDRDYIFIPFARLDGSRSRKTGGLGLGLSIAKTSANCLGGDIKVENSQFGGAKFILSLSQTDHQNEK